MGKYAEYVKEFLEDYKPPQLREYIVGYSGITPDRLVKASEIDHEELGGLEGGDFSGHYHLTLGQLEEFGGYGEDISTLRADAFAEAKRVEDKEDAAISTLRTDAFAEAKRVEDKEDAAISTLRTDAFAEAKRVEDKASSDIATLRTETEQEISRAESLVSDQANRLASEAERAREEVTSAHQEFVDGMSYLKGEQAQLSRQNRELEARIDEVIGGVTEDGEILDARIDSDGETHSTVGENVRCIQDELRRDVSSARLDATAKFEHMREQAQELADELLKNELEKNFRADTGASVNDYLREQIDTNAYTAISLAVQLSRKTNGGTIYTNPLDWSRSDTLAIPEPRCAVVNLSGIDGMPTTKDADYSAIMEFWDMAGNYFKKPIVCSAQGQSSMAYPKKNVKFDLLNEDGTEFKLKIGDWVVQDGYHLKAYYCDLFRGVAMASYQLWEEIMRFNAVGCYVRQTRHIAD